MKYYEQLSEIIRLLNHYNMCGALFLKGDVKLYRESIPLFPYDGTPFLWVGRDSFYVASLEDGYMTNVHDCLKNIYEYIIRNPNKILEETILEQRKKIEDLEGQIKQLKEIK